MLLWGCFTLEWLNRPSPLTFLHALQTDCALWTVQLQRKPSGKEVLRAISGKLPTFSTDTLALCLYRDG